MENKYFLSIAFMFLLYGCKKDDEALPELIGEYHIAKNISAASPIIMYTKDGLVNNQQVIDKFLSKRFYKDNFSRTDMPVSANDSIGVPIALSISANNQVAFTTKNLNILAGRSNYTSYKAELISQTPQYFVLAQIDSSISYAGYPSGITQCTQLVQEVAQINPAKKCRTVLVGTYNIQACTYRPIRVIAIKNGKLVLPFCSYAILSKRNGLDCEQGFVGMQNFFNKGLFNKLLAGDTILVQEREIDFIKK